MVNLFRFLMRSSASRSIVFSILGCLLLALVACSLIEPSPPPSTRAATTTAPSPSPTPTPVRSPTLTTAARVRMPAEFEPIQGVVFTWGISHPYYGFVRTLVGEVVRASDVYIYVDHDAMEAEARRALSQNPNVDFSHVHFIHQVCNSVWQRNYGGIGIVTPEDKLGFLDPRSSRHWRRDDDVAPRALAQYLKVNCYEWPLVLDGGNIMTDGQGTVFYTTKIYEWNDTSWGGESAQRSKEQITQLITDYTGHSNHIVLPYQNAPYDGTGHLDMFAKIITPKKVLIGRSPPGGYNHEVLEKAYQILINSTNARGEPFEVISLPTETNHHNDDLQYANSLIVNGTRGKLVLVPTYRIPADELALQLYRQHLPDYEIVGIDSSDIIGSNGTIQCVTQTIPLVSPKL